MTAGFNPKGTSTGVLIARNVCLALGGIALVVWFFMRFAGLAVGVGQVDYHAAKTELWRRKICMGEGRPCFESRSPENRSALEILAATT